MSPHSEFTVRKCTVIFLAEFLGSAILMFNGCLTTIQFSEPPDALIGSLGFGFTVAMIICIFGPHSGAHVNPSVTVCGILLGNLPPWLFLVYLPAQVLGALAGFGLLTVAVPKVSFLALAESGICLSLPMDGMDTATAFLCEFSFTAILILVCCGMWDVRSRHLQESAAIKFGLTIAALSMAGGKLTGVSMNPVRSLAPAIWQKNLSSQWVYWAAPISSSIVTTLFYRLVMQKP